jgi:hypothetical protein
MIAIFFILVTSFNLEFDTYVETIDATTWVAVHLAEHTLKVVAIGTGLWVDVVVSLVAPGEQIVGKHGEGDITQEEFACDRFRQSVRKGDVTQLDE